MEKQPIEAFGTVSGSRVLLDDGTPWPDGTRLVIRPAQQHSAVERSKRNLTGHVIIVGFGLAGRSIAEQLTCSQTPFVIIEQNPNTIATQQALGHRVVQGGANQAETLLQAGLQNAAILALTIPNEEAVLDAIALTRRYRPDLYIIARTNYSSKGMRASQLGADEVIKAEQAVAIQFHERVKKLLQKTAASTT